MAIWDNWSAQNIGASIADAAGFDSFANTLGAEGFDLVGDSTITPSPYAQVDAPAKTIDSTNDYRFYNDPGMSSDLTALDGGGTVGGGTGEAKPTSGQLTGVQSEIMQRAEAANAIFKTLMGGVDKVLADRSGQLRKSSQLTQDQLQRQSQTEGSAASGQYAARGLTDSSFRAKSLGAIGDEYSRLSGVETDASKAEQAALGQFGATKRASLTEDNASAQRAIQTAQELVTSGTFSDLASLQTLRDSLDKAIGEMNVEKAGMQTQEGFLGALKAAAPGVNRFQELSTQLTQIANSATPAELKNQMIQGLITSDETLTEEEKQELGVTFLTPLGA